MDLCEYEGKRYFQQAGIPVPKGLVLSRLASLTRVEGDLRYPLMVKAQIPAGGRGKAGGILPARDSRELKSAVQRLLGHQLKGHKVGRLLIEERLEVARELYLGITIDTLAGCPLVVASSAGGISVEETARDQDNLASLKVSPSRGLRVFEAIELLKRIGLRGHELVKAADIVVRMYRVLVEMDAVTVEVNPLVVDMAGNLWAADAKVVLDDDALFRHPDLVRQSGIRPSDPLERRAARQGLVYVNLDGDVAIFSMGAGFTMSLLDSIVHFGGRPANFADLTGGSGPDRVKEMMDIILSKAGRDRRVRSILINVTLTATPLANVVNGIAQALQAHPSPVSLFCSLHAGDASVLSMSLAEAESIFAGFGISTFSSVREAIQTAISGGKRLGHIA